MTLTEEQRKRIEKNRKRALEIKRKKQLEQQQQQNQKVENHINDESSTSPAKSIFDAGGFIGKSASDSKKRKLNNDGGAYNNGSNGQEKMACSNSDTTKLKRGINNNNDIESDTISLEEFEQNASQYISQTEAQRLYCIPKGTLDVCSYIEKDNPHKRGWSKMKLYYRNDVRTRAYKRFGGKEGLIAEREKRRKKRSDKDLEAVKNVFR